MPRWEQALPQVFVLIRRKPGRELKARLGTGNAVQLEFPVVDGSDLCRSLDVQFFTECLTPGQYLFGSI